MALNHFVLPALRKRTNRIPPGGTTSSRVSPVESSVTFTVDAFDWSNCSSSNENFVTPSLLNSQTSHPSFVRFTPHWTFPSTATGNVSSCTRRSSRRISSNVLVPEVIPHITLFRNCKSLSRSIFRETSSYSAGIISLHATVNTRPLPTAFANTATFPLSSHHAERPAPPGSGFIHEYASLSGKRPPRSSSRYSPDGSRSVPNATPLSDCGTIPAVTWSAETNSVPPPLTYASSADTSTSCLRYTPARNAHLYGESALAKRSVERRESPARTS